MGSRHTSRSASNDLEFLRRGDYGIDVFGANASMPEVGVARAWASVAKTLVGRNQGCKVTWLFGPALDAENGIEVGVGSVRWKNQLKIGTMSYKGKLASRMSNSERSLEEARRAPEVQSVASNRLKWQ